MASSPPLANFPKMARPPPHKPGGETMILILKLKA